MNALTKLNAVEAKAIRLVARDHVGTEITAARVFPVRSDNDSHTFTVVIATDEPHRSTCTCLAGANGRRCSHLIACELVIEREALAAA